MREINIGTKLCTTVIAVDEPEFGANHEYEIRFSLKPEEGDVTSDVAGKIKFQKGPVKEHGRNGIHNEDLIAIAIDRLIGFQNTDFKCDDNQHAITHLRAALGFLNQRTRERRERGVEGKNKV